MSSSVKKSGVEAVDRALNLLNCFDAQNARLSLAELSRKTGYYKSTILRLAVSLENAEYLQRDSDGFFRLGPTLWRLGSLYRRSFDFAEFVRPVLRNLCDGTGETSSFYIREGHKRICLYRAEPNRALRHNLSEGASFPIDDSASGQVLRAWSDDHASQSMLQSQGYAISFGVRDAEIASMSVPVFNQENAFCGALTISGPIGRYHHQSDLLAFASKLKDEAARLGRQLL